MKHKIKEKSTMATSNNTGWTDCKTLRDGVNKKLAKIKQMAYNVVGLKSSAMITYYMLTADLLVHIACSQLIYMLC